MKNYEELIETMEASVSVLSCRTEGLCPGALSDRLPIFSTLKMAINRLVVSMGLLRDQHVPRQRHRVLRHAYNLVRRISRIIDDLGPRLGICRQALRIVREKVIEIMVSLRIVFTTGTTGQWTRKGRVDESKSSGDRSLLRPWKTTDRTRTS